ncbi:MAG: chemotaxis protein CheW, partial [Sphingobacteriales bacterium]
MKSQKLNGFAADLNEHYVSFIVAGQLFGIPVTQVREILKRQDVAHVPLAPKKVAGSLNLRGRIVTAINLHSLLNLSYYLD